MVARTAATMAGRNQTSEVAFTRCDDPGLDEAAGSWENEPVLVLKEWSRGPAPAGSVAT